MSRSSGSKTAASGSAIGIVGVSPTRPVRVVYNQSPQPAEKTPTPLLDVALGLVGIRDRARQPVVTDQAIGSLAGALLGKRPDDES